MTHFILATTRI